MQNVKKEFFGYYVISRRYLSKNIRGIPDSDLKDRYAHTILNRLIFLWFLQIKGFLDNDFNYLISKFTKYKDNNYYKGFLTVLFFEGLCKTFDDRGKFANQIIGEIPFLNADLFLPTEEELRYGEKIEIPNSVFYKPMPYSLSNAITSLPVLNLLESRPWTIDEKSGDMSKVKPDTLGYMFEKSINQKALGAIYTPNEITSKMCQTTIIEYTNNTLGFNYSTFKNLLEENDEKKQFKILDLVKTIKILDPSVGSGDFLVEMLFHIETIHNAFENTGNKFFKAELETDGGNLRNFIITNNLFGVDISSRAIEICKMRLFLAIIKKFSSVKEISPLPNIDFYYRCGNSVIGIYERSDGSILDFMDKSILTTMKKRNQQIRKYERMSGIQSRKTREKIISETRELNNVFTKKLLDKPELKDFQEKYSLQQFNDKFNPFHWIMEFSEILQSTNGGFDIIIGNPPYIRADSQDLVYQEYRRILEKNFSLLTQKWDIFIPFLELSIKLLKSNGIMSFIISDGFSTSNYASKMRKYILTKELIEVCFFPSIQIFETVTVNNVILSLRNKNRNIDYITKRIFFKSLKEVEKIEKVKIEDYGEKVFRKKDYSSAIGSRINTVTIPLSDIFYISVGMVLNSDEKRFKGKFTKNDLIRDKKGKDFNIKYVENKHINKFQINEIKYLEYGTDRVPGQIRRATFPELYNSPKLMVGAIGGRGVYDETANLVCNHSIMILKPYHDLVGVKTRVLNRKSVKEAIHHGKRISSDFNPRYILGILNSSFANKFLNSIRTHRQENYFQPNDLKKLPIPYIDRENQSQITEVVERIEQNRTLYINESNHDGRNKLETQFKQSLIELDEQINDLYS